MRLFSTLLLLAGVASSCQSCDEYLLSGTFALGSEFRLLTDGSVFTDGELSVERGAESRNSATLRLWKTGGCQVSLTWPIDARGETPTQGSLSCGANLDDLGGTVLVQDLQVDSWDESENGDTGARLTIDLGGVRAKDQAVLTGAGTVGFGTLGKGGAGGGGGTGGSGSDGGTSGGCVNQFSIVKLSSQRLPSESLASGKANIAATGQLIRNSGGAAQVTLASTELNKDGQPHWFLRVQVPADKLAPGKVDLVDDQNITGLEKGGVGNFTYDSFETFWTNKDYSRDVVRGSVSFTAVNPKVQGSFTFKAYADGYPSTNTGEVDVNGTFCVQ